MDTYHFRKQIHRLPGKVIHAVPLPTPEVTAETLHQLGYDEAVMESLQAAGVNASLFSDIHSEPNSANIRIAAKQVKRK